MKYYLGGYYLIKPKRRTTASKGENPIYSCSDCINDNLVDAWSYSWTTENDKYVVEAKETFKLSDKDIAAIRAWVDNKHNENKLGWLNVFTDLPTAIEYQSTFFQHQTDIQLLALYFDEQERNALLDEFRPQKTGYGEIGLSITLLKGIEENPEEKVLGFDYIGIEDGGDFHSFHCHDLGPKLSSKFHLTLNNLGLFEDCNNSDQVLDYLNDEKNGCEPVPWFITKTKLVPIKSKSQIH
jgi:hypothetical protein